MASTAKTTHREPAALGAYLERVRARLHRRDLLAGDPLVFLHRYSDPRDVEVAGLIAALFAFGRVAQILATVERVLGTLGPRPSEAIRRFDPSRDATGHAGFVHRWCRARDLVGLLAAIRGALEGWGSLESLFLAGYAPGRSDTMRRALAAFAGTLRGLAAETAAGARPDRTGRALRFLLPDPESGSACKRLNLYLRWMVRRDDPLDRGVWRSVSPADLVMPLDTHVARIARNLGLSARRAADWRMAEEVTAALRRIDPGDPTRFDFALCRLGILDECPPRAQRRKCLACDLRRACRLHAAMQAGRDARRTSGAAGRGASRAAPARGRARASRTRARGASR